MRSLIALTLASGALTCRADGGGAAVPDDWNTHVQREIAADEYEASWQTRTVLADVSAAWQAPNRAHGFRTYFTERGVRIVPRLETTPTWEWGLALAGWGRGDEVRSLPGARVAVRANRIEYVGRPLDEWYLNSDRGLEQGFTLPAPPDGQAGSGHDSTTQPVHLDLELLGTLDPVVSADGQSIDFRTAGGVFVLRVAELSVRDATGRTLPAWMEGTSSLGRGLRIVVDDHDAVYPITIDPLATSPSWSVEGNQYGANLGQAVASAGDVNGDGYVDVIIGAPSFDNGQTNEGRAYLFLGAASGLTSTPAWTAESDQGSAAFGTSVGAAGDVNGDGYADVIVGAPYFDAGQTDEGRAFVYLGSASGLSAAAAWTAESNQASAYFGQAVATAGDVNGDGYSDVSVGAPYFDNGQTDEGRAFVFLGSASGLASTAAWTAESNQASAQFGSAVGTAGDVNGDGYADVIVGAPLYTNGQSAEGRAYVYLGSATGLSATAAWTREVDVASAYFGYAVGTAGDVNGDGYADVIVGAPYYSLVGGKAFVYHGSAGGLFTTAAWSVDANQGSAEFGHAVGTAGDVNGDGYADVIVGAPYFDNGQTDEGRAFVYFGSAAGLSATPAWTTESDQASAFFGQSVATAGDVNGDGYADVIVGAPGYTDPDSQEGRAFLYLGGAAGSAASPGWFVDGPQAWCNFSYSLASAGDVNGDGYADVIVGAPLFDGGWMDSGRAYLFLGSAAGLAGTASWTADGDEVYAYFGSSVASAGDVNGDGYSDVVIGEILSPAATTPGRAFVYQGSAAGLSAAPSWSAQGEYAGGSFGAAVAGAGDVDGDGFADVVIGENTGTGAGSQGRVAVYVGSTAGLSVAPAWVVVSDELDFGNSASSAGDVNGDGYADVLVGLQSKAYVYAGSPSGPAAAPSWTVDPHACTGRAGTAGDVNGDGYADIALSAGCSWQQAFVFLGSASGPSTAPAWSGPGGGGYGYAIAAAGDVNGDGFSDVVVGDYSYANGQAEEGKAWLFFGSASGLATTAAWTYESDVTSALFGWPVASAGDVNGDGYADLLVGAYNFPVGGYPGGGRAYLFYGNGGPGVALRARQRTGDDAAPVAPLGMSERRDAFRLAATGRAPSGRSKVKLEWEAKPLGVPFDGTGKGRSASWFDTATSGAALDELVSSLTGGTPYHWRARLLYNIPASPFLPASRWFTGAWNGLQEMDLRTFAQADVSVTLTGGPDPVLIGNLITYVITFGNAGPDAGQGDVHDVLPTNVSFVSATPSQGTCTPSTGVVECHLGTVASGAAASVTIVVAPNTPGVATNSVTATVGGRDPNGANDHATTTTLVRAPAIGDRVWQDLDGDGIQDAGEPGLANVLVSLQDAGGAIVATAVTAADGSYSFPSVLFGTSASLRFYPPLGYSFSPRDLGSDDLLDSDIDPAGGTTLLFAVVNGNDPVRWDAGMILDNDGDGFTIATGDCNEANAAVHPGALEGCNGLDDDCDGRVDEGCDAQCDLPAKAASETDLSPASKNAGSTRLIWTGSCYALVFTDTRDGNPEIYFARYDAQLGRLGGDVRVTIDPGNSAMPHAAWSGSEFGIVWQDDRSGTQQIYFARLDAAGNRIGVDVPLTSQPGTGRSLPRIAWSGGDYGVVWMDRRSGIGEVYFVRVGAKGEVFGPEKRLTVEPYESGPPRIDWNGSAYGIAYPDLRDGNYEIYFQAVDRYGNTVTPETRLTNTPGTSSNVVVAWNGTAGEFGVVWLDVLPDTSTAIFFTRVATTGTKLTGDHNLTPTVSTASATLSLVHSGGEYGLAWLDQPGGTTEVYFGHLSQDALNGSPVRLTTDPASDMYPSIAWSGSEYAVAFTDNRAAAGSYHPFAARVACCAVTTIGDRVWSDANRNGIQDIGETGMSGMLVALFDATGGLVSTTVSDAQGRYGFTAAACGSGYSLQFYPPAGYFLSPRDQGGDDTLDSDADPATGRTGPFVLSGASDALRWDAGMHACWAPDEPVYLYSIGLSPDGMRYPVLNFEDPNQSGQISGYNVRRSSTAAPPPATWPLLATDVVDMDEAAPNKQWVDQTGDVSPTGVWFYQVTAYNNACPAEGPF